MLDGKVSIFLLRPIPNRGNNAAAIAFMATMSLIASFLLASSVVTFSGYVPPHAAADGLRFRVVADIATDLSAAMAQCGIKDFAPVETGGAVTAYKFAVTRAAGGGAQCLRARLPATATIAPLDQWTTDAATD